MSTHKKSEKNKSLCEKSMEIMVNIIKVSSFSLATMNLGDQKHSSKRPVTISPTEPLTNVSSNSHISKRKRSAQASVTTKVQTYLMEQDSGDPRPSPPYKIYGSKEDTTDDGNFSDFIKRFHKKNQNELNTTILNVKANAYIRKFHEKNSRDYSLAAPDVLPLVLPPPPPCIKK